MTDERANAIAETQAVARAALDASGVTKLPRFIAMFPAGAIPLRTFRRWLMGEGPADAMALMVLREFAAGWRPKLNGKE